MLGVKAGGYFPGNADKGMINHQSSVFLFDPDTGRPTAMVGGNLLTALRTAAASAISIDRLARADAKVLGIVGAGHQAGFQLRAAARARGFERVIAWNLHPEMLPKLGAVAAELGLPFEAVPLERMVRGRCDRHHHLVARGQPDGGACGARHASGLHGHRYGGQAGGGACAAGARARCSPMRWRNRSASARRSMRWRRGCSAARRSRRLGAVLIGRASGPARRRRRSRCLMAPAWLAGSGGGRRGGDAGARARHGDRGRGLTDLC